MKQLELIVDQPVQGHYYWTIVDLGQAGESHCVLDYAQGPLATLGAARDAGLAVLVRHREGGSRQGEPIVLH